MTIPAEQRAVAPPERPGGQGLDHNQEESGNRAIHMILTHPVVGGQTHALATYRDGAYEVWSTSGMVRFERAAGANGYEYNVIGQIGANPVEHQDALAVASVEEELEAARRSGHPTDEPNETFIEPEHLSYPLAYERISQLFDSPNAPDIVLNPKSYAFGRQPGQHGSLDVVQSRAPLCFAGPGVRPGVSDTAARHIDIAPTIARLMGFPKVSGRDMCGRPSKEVYFKRQDGRPLDAIIDESGDQPERVYIFHLDGFGNDELTWRLDNQPEALPNLRALVERSHRFRYGSIVNFPSITWPSHNAIGTSCWCGHHDIVNPTYYLRETRQVVTPQGQQFDSAKFLSPDVETLYEAFHRVYGSWDGMDGALTAAIHEPCTRGADHSVLERKIVGNRDLLRSYTAECESDRSPRWAADEMTAMQNESTVDTRGVAQVLALFTDDSLPPPRFVFHEFTLTDGTAHDYGPHSAGHRDAVDETDKRIGRVVSMLKQRGYYDSMLFVITADHGMAAINTELAANQVDLLPKEGMKAIVPAPLIYLIDMAVEIEHARDGRTATFTVLANDPDESGEQPPVAGAQITVSGPGGDVLARVTTDVGGVAGVPLPVEVPAHDVVVTVHHDDYNTRHLRLDGSNIVIDLREQLYGRDA